MTDSFKVAGTAEKRLMLTATYRNHFYIEKLLGNLIGLTQLLKFVANEAGIEAGSLTVISTHATTTQQCKASVTEIRKLINDCSAVILKKEAA